MKCQQREGGRRRERLERIGGNKRENRDKEGGESQYREERSLKNNECLSTFTFCKVIV